VCFSGADSRPCFFIVFSAHFLILGSPLASLGHLKASFFASFGDLGAGWAQKSSQGLQKTHFGTLLGAVWEVLGYVLLTFQGVVG